MAKKQVKYVVHYYFEGELCTQGWWIDYEDAYKCMCRHLKKGDFAWIKKIEK